MDEKPKLDGTWVNGVFKLVIKRNTYVSFLNGCRYGKGTMIYDNDTFTLTSSHARWLFLWVPFIERVKGKYVLTNDELTVSNIEGRYSYFNGTWVYIRRKK